ncbi:unnamed protein product [Owenia fusiformis]|uniref:L-Fucosyltransferase n=1 Tax=Owenia fusiformis TaxID=6347 RepID=A0A8J1XKU7_OWEFU|nr:unnamed protein product [Owenia fusiformis]
MRIIRLRLGNCGQCSLILRLLVVLGGIFLLRAIWVTPSYKNGTQTQTRNFVLRNTSTRNSLQRSISRLLFSNGYTEKEENIISSMFEMYHPKTRNNTYNFTYIHVPDIPRQDDRPRRLYLEHGTGRLGNKLFHVAAAISIAIANNMELYLPYDTDVVRIFNMTQFNTYTPPEYDAFNKSGGKIKIIHHVSYVEEYMDMAWKYHVKLDKGGVQTYLYFWKYQPLIRSLYVFNKFIQYQIQFFMSELQRKYSQFGNLTYIGIHCRRGDRAYDKEIIKAGYQATPISYFQKAINFTLTRYKTPIIYVVATDDRDWTTKYLKNPGENTFIEHTPWGLTAEYDMGILSSMNHTIMSTGSFGWWAAYLAGGDVIYYNQPFKPKTIRGKHWQRWFQTQMYPREDNWIGMDAS